MRTNRRDVLRAGGLLLAGVGLAGCTGSGNGDETTGETGGGGAGSTDGGSGSSAGSASISAELAVAAEWNVMRARAYDALALGLAGDANGGSRIARDVFARFERAGGEWGVHEVLEETSREHYEEFEEAIGELGEEALGAGDLDRAGIEAGLVGEHLAAAQTKLVGETNAHALDVLAFGARTEDAATLAAADRFDAAVTVAATVLEDFESADSHEAFEEADHGAYEAFEGAVEAVERAAKAEKPEAVRSETDAAVDAAVAGAYAIAGPEQAGTGHLALMQGGGFDAAALASVGGPGAAYAHASTLTTYRARVHDAAWLASRGKADAATRMVSDVFAHFEGARAHEALEGADGDAYEGFEGGLEELKSAIGDGEDAVAAAVETVDTNLVAGIDAVAGGTGAAVLESAFFRMRVADARERSLLGGADVAADVASGLFERFERNEAGFHERFEEADHGAYEAFEGHLESLIEAFEAGDDAAAETHASAAHESLLGFGTSVGSSAQVAVAQSGYVAARGFDAAVLGELGEHDRAGAVVENAFRSFEENAGGLHESLEEADHGAYESFEDGLTGAGSAVESTGDVYAKAKGFNGTAIDASYAVVAAAGGSFGTAATAIGRGVFATFEDAEVHDALESADRGAYEAFEMKLDGLIGALEEGTGIDAALDGFATATLRAEFAVAGAVGKAPVGGASGESGGGAEADLQGGPNVREGVPEDVDHVVEVKAVSFAPDELTVSVGDTVAWKHVGGEAHTVTADATPEGAYFASGGFDFRSAAEEGWENGKGAVRSGQSFVHTFETAGEYEYVCLPHEAAGMTGRVVVEK